MSESREGLPDSRASHSSTFLASSASSPFQLPTALSKPAVNTPGLDLHFQDGSLPMDKRLFYFYHVDDARMPGRTLTPCECCAPDTLPTLRSIELGRVVAVLEHPTLFDPRKHTLVCMRTHHAIYNESSWRAALSLQHSQGYIWILIGIQLLGAGHGQQIQYREFQTEARCLIRY